jgi:hypothetical protein
MTRVDSLEDSLQRKIEEAIKTRSAETKGRMFGGFFGPRAKQQQSQAVQDS